MTQTLVGKIAPLVTGATRGIGARFCRGSGPCRKVLAKSDAKERARYFNELSSSG